MKLTILGCHSATPKVNAFPTAQILELKGHLFLIDCGEGTQVQLRKYKVKFSRIKHIFISHLHGDHFFGLIGLISTFRLLDRENDLHIYGPKGLEKVINLQLKLGNSFGKFKLIFHELNSNSSEIILDDDKVSVETIPLDHRVYTNGFLFKEKVGDRKLNINSVLNYDIEQCYYNAIKKGKDVPNKKGEIIDNNLVSLDPGKPKSYAYCSDTMYSEKIISIIKETTLLYHESTFLNSHEHLCAKTKHTTAQQAGKIAKLANVKQLLLGHFSSRYSGYNQFKEEAELEFNNVSLAKEGKVFEI